MVNKIPAFYTFFEAGEDNVKLKIPIVFTQCMDEPYPQRVFLRDRNNHHWPIKMEEVGEYCCFVHGWEKFVNDNLLTTGDLLTFAYIERTIFIVKLYGTCGIEKKIIGPSTMRGSEAHVQLSEDKETDDGGHEIISRHANNEGAGSNNRQGRALALGLYPKSYGMEIFAAGLAEKPANPYFVTKFRPRRMNSLFMPMDVFKDHSLTFSDKITLVDPKGREFESNCTQWSDGRVVVSGGWAQLCRINALNDGDKCICEFVQREGEERKFLRISFVRSNV